MRTFAVKTLVFVFLFTPPSVLAASALVQVDTRGAKINAIEGVLVLPDGMNVRAQTGNSVISLWVEEPHVTDNTVRFSGITPGGFEGRHPLFTISGAFTPRELENARFDKTIALVNDGAGTRAPVWLSLSPVSFRGDIEPPEDFTPMISSDPSMFGGDYFVVFATQDKNSGISRYEVREGRWGWFQEAQSPYLLKHQRLDRKLYIKAIDNAGNRRVAVIPARNSGGWERYGFFAILMALLFLIHYVRHRKKHRNQ